MSDTVTKWAAGWSFTGKLLVEQLEFREGALEFLLALEEAKAQQTPSPPKSQKMTPAYQTRSQTSP
jgi:hypothetical protein